MLLLIAGVTNHLFAQTQVEFRGTVVEGKGQQPVEFATVLALDPATRQNLAGTTSLADGSFALTVPSAEVLLEVSFIGFVSQTFQEFQVVDGSVDVGRVVLEETVTTLDEVVIESEKSQVEFKLDKRVFNVGSDLSSTGASALEVLNNVPSVNVNIEGEIRLRGSAGVQILINGKPSVLANEQGNALGTITADMIERVEVITNPSAKYEAEGTAGIINIVMKKEEKKGINGSVTLNTGLPNNHSLGLSLNRRTEKFNLFTQMGVGHRTFPEDLETINRNLLSQTTISSFGQHDKNETFYNLILGTDYHINAYNVLSLTGHFAYEIESEFSDANFFIRDANETLTSAWNRDEETRATNPKWQYDLQYAKQFRDHEDHTLLMSALGNFFGKDQSADFINKLLEGAEPAGDQQTRTDFQEAEYTFKLDYTRPFAEQYTLETGAQYVITDVSNDYEVNEWIDGQWVADPNLTNLFDYDQKVLGTYATGAYEGDKWGIKLGLRLEHTDLQTLLVQTNEANDQNFVNLFPSFHSSYKITETFSMQAGYSRRISRPSLWDLNPFFNVRNNFSIRTGNPELMPEFTDSYELTGIYLLEKLSLNLGVYHRFTTDVVERISTFQNDVNFIKPLNIGTNKTTGIEFNAKYTPLQWLSFTGDFNYRSFEREGTLETTRFDFRANQWTSRLTSKLKLPVKLDMEFTFQYLSPFQTVQGEVSENLFLDLGLRQKIMKGKAVINLSVRDLFASRVMERNTFQPEFSLYDRRQRGRFVTLGFSYGFGKGEAMEFSGQKQF